MIKNILIGTVLVLAMIASAGATEVRVDPASQMILLGTNFQVNVTVEDVEDLAAPQAVLNFDPSAMQVTDIIESDFLTDGGAYIPIEIVNNALGTALFSYSFNSVTDKVSGTGTLATIQFSTYPDAPAGTYNLNLTDVLLLGVDESGDECDIQTDVSNGTVTLLVPTLNITQARTDKTIYNLNENAAISCIVQNETEANITADSVNTKIIKPDSLVEWITLSESSTGNYSAAFTNTSLAGIYNVTIYANKTGYENDTAELSFEIVPPLTATIIAPTTPSSYIGQPIYVSPPN